MNNRVLIMNSEIQKAISEIINYQLNNPKISGIITVTKVDTASDLDTCKVYLSIYTQDNKEDVFNAIKHSATFIRRELASKVKLRKMPFLHFLIDNSIEINDTMGKLIDKVISDDLKG